MDHFKFFISWSFWLFRKGNFIEAKAAFLEAFDKGRAEREAKAALSARQEKSYNEKL